MLLVTYKNDVLNIKKVSSVLGVDFSRAQLGNQENRASEEDEQRKISGKKKESSPAMAGLPVPQVDCKNQTKVLGRPFSDRSEELSTPSDSKPYISQQEAGAAAVIHLAQSTGYSRPHEVSQLAVCIHLAALHRRAAAFSSRESTLYT